MPTAPTPTVVKGKPGKGSWSNRASDTPVGYVPGKSTENASKRTATSETFVNPDGSNSRVLFPYPVFVNNGAGTLVPVDTRLRRSASRMVTTATSVPVSLAGKGADPSLATVSTSSSSSLSFSLDGARPVVGVDKSVEMVYPKILAGVDLVLRPTVSGVKESLILSSAHAPAKFTFEVTPPTGTTPSVGADGAVVFTAAAGDEVARIPAGYMFDSTKGLHSGLPAGSDGVRYRVAKSGAKWTLTVTLDRAWLSDSARKFPVTVDPSVTITDAEDDTWVQEGASVSHAGPGSDPNLPGAEQYLAVGPVPPDEGDGQPTISLLHIPLSTLAGQTISAAQLELDEVWSASCTPRQVNIQAVAAGSANAWVGSTANWDNRPALDPAVLSSQTAAHGWDDGSGTSPCRAPAAVNFPIAAAKVAGWVAAPSTYNGLAITYPAGVDWLSWKKFASYDSPVATNAPHLVVTYASPAVEDARYNATALTPPTATAAGSAKIDVTNTGTAPWAAGAGFKLAYTVVVRGTSTPAGPAQAPVAVTAAAGATAHVTVPIPALPHGAYTITLNMHRPNGTGFNAADGTPLGLVDFSSADLPPNIYSYSPSPADATSLAPTLNAAANDPDDATSTLQYDFVVCSNIQETQDCNESGYLPTPSFSVPAGWLSWNATSYWKVTVKDPGGLTYAVTGISITAEMTQPLIGNSFGQETDSQNAPGLNVASENYTTSTTDLAVNGIGPVLSVSRTYNSQNITTSNAFGTGWTTGIDAHLAVDTDGTGNVVLTSADGRQSRYGKLQGTRTFASPDGDSSRLVLNTDGSYTLASAGGITTKFDSSGLLASNADAAGRTVTYTRTGGHITTVTNTTSGRAVTYGWTAGHVTSVTSDPVTAGGQPIVWTYQYDGDQLTKACSPLPGSPCTTYASSTTNQFFGAVNDSAASQFYPLGSYGYEVDSPEFNYTIASNVLQSECCSSGGVFESDSPLAGTSSTSEVYNGTSTHQLFRTSPFSGNQVRTVQIWFKTTKAGVILSAQDQPIGGASTKTDPVLYVGTDGKLHGTTQIGVNGAAVPVVSSTAAVNDDRWHLTALSVGGNRQTLFVDGQSVGTLVGTGNDLSQLTTVAIGAGTPGGVPAAPAGQGYFTGHLTQLAFYSYAIGADQAASLWQARQPVPVLTGITLPEANRTFVALTYSPLSGQVSTLIDHTGTTWTTYSPFNLTKNDSVFSLSVDGGVTVPFRYRFSRVDGRLGLRFRYPGNGQVESYSMDALGRTTEFQDSDGNSTKYSYDSYGNVTLVGTNGSHGDPATQRNITSTYFESGHPLDPRNGVQLTSAAQIGTDVTSKVPGSVIGKTLDAVGDVLTTTYQKPAGQSTNPVVTNSYATGSEAAVDTGTIPQYLLTKTIGARGQITSYRYFHDGDLARVTGPTGLVTSYTYDNLGRRSSTTAAPGGTTTYSYDAVGNVTSTTSPTTVNPVSGASHQLKSATTFDADGNPLTVTSSDLAGGDTARTTTNTYNSHDEVASTTDPAGNATTAMTYNLRGDLVSSTAPDGIVTSNTYSFFRHLLLSSTLGGAGVDPTDPAATSLVTQTNQYDPDGLLAAHSDAAGQQTAYTYTPWGAKATVVASNVADAAGAAHDITLESDTYNAAGWVTSTVKSGVTTNYTYDPAGNIATSTLDPGGINQVTAYSYDPDSNPTSVSATGDSSPGRTEVTDRTYDPAGYQLSSTVHGDGTARFTTATTRDARGLPVTVTDPAGAATSYTYDPAGEQTSSTAPSIDTTINGAAGTATPTVSTGYDTFGDQTQTKDPDGNVTTATYNTNGQILTSTLPSYTPVGGTPITATTTTGYDSMGRPATVTDPAGKATSYTYSPQGWLATQTDPAVGANPAGMWTASYDKVGNVASQTNPVGATVKSTYDGLGRQLTSTSVERATTVGSTNLPLTNYTTTNTYDQVGDLTAQTTPEGKKSSYTYDAAGNQLTATDPAAHAWTAGYDLDNRPAAVTDPDGIKMSATYDLAGRQTTTVKSHGTTTQTTTIGYDPDNRPTTTTSPAGRHTEQAYNAVGDLVSVTQHPSATTTSTAGYGYDPAGNRTASTDGNSNVTTTSYSPWNQPDKITVPATTQDLADRTFTTSYNALRQVAATTSPGGVSTTNTYDALGDLTGQTGTGAAAATTPRTFTYNSASQLTAFSAGTGTETVAYYDRGLLKTTQGAAGNTTVVYNGDQTINRETTTTAGTANYTYDAADRVATATDPNTGATLTFTNTPAGLPTGYTSKTSTNTVGEKLAKTYDTLDRLATVTATTPTNTVSTTATYSYDADDNLTAKTELGIANTYTYDGASRLASWTAGTGPATNYTYDAASNRTSAGNTTFTYNQRNQLTADNVGNTYTYSPAGQLLNTNNGATQNTATYNAFDQLITDGPATNTYDSLARLATSTGTTLTYQGLTDQVVTAGTSQIDYLQDGTALSAKTGTTASLLVTNNHQDVYAGNTTTGTTAFTRTYDPWGTVTAHTGTAAPAIGYQSCYTDPTTNKTATASRWYTPGTGTFTSRDTITNPAPPIAATNPYTYGNANPLTGTDPTGHWRACAASAADLAEDLVLPEATAGTCILDLGIDAVKVLSRPRAIAGNAIPDAAAVAAIAAAGSAFPQKTTPGPVDAGPQTHYVYNYANTASTCRYCASSPDGGIDYSSPGIDAGRNYTDNNDIGYPYPNYPGSPSARHTTTSGGGGSGSGSGSGSGGGYDGGFYGDGSGYGTSASYHYGGDTHNNASTGGGNQPSQAELRKAAERAHVTANLHIAIDFNDPTSTPPAAAPTHPTTGRPQTVRADNNMAVHPSNPPGDHGEGQTQQAPTSCTTNCHSDPPPPAAAGGGSSNKPPPNTPPTIGTPPEHPDDEADNSESSAEGTAINEGIYVIQSARGTYVGQSGKISSRFSQHLVDNGGRFTQAELDAAERISVLGGKIAREVAEQQKIDELGGIGALPLLNVRNPIGQGRIGLMPQPYSRP